jgi:hypothetical protein
MAGPAALELAAVTKLYGATMAVDRISLRIPAGTYCCLLGPSGCGKTSTLRMIAGHESVSDGDILLGDTIITDLPPARRGTAMMFQSYALFPHLDCIDNVAFSLKMKGVAKAERRARALDLLRLVHMESYAARLPAQLSGGQQQRVAEEAARDQGATPLQTIRHVVLPIIAPSLIGIALFGFTPSYDEFARTLMTSGSFNTLPLEIYGMTTNVTSPVLYALGTVTTGFSLLIILLCLAAALLIQRRRARHGSDAGKGV